LKFLGLLFDGNMPALTAAQNDETFKTFGKLDGDVAEATDLTSNSQIHRCILSQ